MQQNTLLDPLSTYVLHVLPVLNKVDHTQLIVTQLYQPTKYMDTDEVKDKSDSGIK